MVSPPAPPSAPLTAERPPPRPSSAPGGRSRDTDRSRTAHRLQTRIALCAGGGEFCDGWVLGVVGTALPLVRSDLGLSAVWTGLVGTASLFGLFLGGLVFGWLTDRIGRQRMYLIDLLVFLAGSLAQLVVADGLQLVLVRLVMGVAVGADYAIAGALVAEFAAPARRGRLLAGLIVFWYAGFTVAAVLGMGLASWLPGTSAWRWILASSVVPCVVVLASRVGTPESPRWLAGNGRTAEARAVARRYLDPEGEEEILCEPARKTRFTELFRPAHARSTVFVSLFWLCQVTPFFALSTFLPRILDALGVSGGGTGEILLNAFLLAGCVAGMLLVERVGRRKLLIWPFLGTAAALLLLGLLPRAPHGLLVVCFGVFALCHASSSVLQAVYPSEVFPTRIRASGLGFGAAMSRIGSAAGTFLLPLALSSWGVGAVLLLCCAVSLLGALVSFAWAPETARLRLSETSAPGRPGPPGHPAAGTPSAPSTTSHVTTTS